MSFSRRGFLTGAVAAVVAAALPVPALAKLVAPKFARGGFLSMPPEWAKDVPLIHYCNPGEWARIAATGYDMHDCRLVGLIPVTKGDIYVKRKR